MTDSVLTPAIREGVGRLERADIVVGIPNSGDPATLRHVVLAVQAGLVQAFPERRAVLVTMDADGAAGPDVQIAVGPEPAEDLERILFVRPGRPLERIRLGSAAFGGVGSANLAMLEIAADLEAEVLVLLDGTSRSILPEWLELLARPILRDGIQFVAPLTNRPIHDGAITNTLAYPLTRALYGRRLRQPMGGDVGLGAGFVRHCLSAAKRTWSPDIAGSGIGAWLTTEALAGGFAVCEARLGARVAGRRDGPDSVDDPLGPFGEITRTVIGLTLEHADRWLDIDGSTELAAYGFERKAEAPPVRVDPVRLLQAFEAGASGARDAWLGILAPSTGSAVLGLAVTAAGVSLSARDWLNLDRGADIARLDTLTLANAMSTFRFPDDVWARVVYDVLVAARRGDRPVGELVAALQPIAAGRIASLIVEVRGTGPDELERLVERQAQTFERLKPEFVARWRAVSGAGGPAGGAAWAGAGAVTGLATGAAAGASAGHRAAGEADPTAAVAAAGDGEAIEVGR